MNQNIIIINRDHKNYDFPKITVPKSSYIAKVQISIFLMQQIKNVLLGAGKIIKNDRILRTLILAYNPLYYILLYQQNLTIRTVMNYLQNSIDKLQINIKSFVRRHDTTIGHKYHRRRRGWSNFKKLSKKYSFIVHSDFETI